MAKILIIEAFYGGSHKQLLDTILANFLADEYNLFTLPAKKWHWRARTSAIHFSQIIPSDHSYEVLFTTSIINLAELIGMRPDLSKCKKCVYFHENQLVYPLQEIKQRDCQYGFNEIMTCVAADQIIFNSAFNRDSFLNNITTFTRLQSDLRLSDIKRKIESKCCVLYYPIKFDKMLSRPEQNCDRNELQLLWPHRWEHDKNPRLMADVLIELNQRGIHFSVSIVGEHYDERPNCFKEIHSKLSSKIKCFGYLSREDYLKCLIDSDIVISTADHEFYGVSMLEAVYSGCIPLAPNKLVYPEIYPGENLYNTEKQLVKKLQNWCKNPSVFHKHRRNFFQSFNFDKYSSSRLVPIFENLLRTNVSN